MDIERGIILEKFSNEYFKKLANDLRFDLNDEEIEALKRDFIEAVSYTHLTLPTNREV